VGGGGIKGKKSQSQIYAFKVEHSNTWGDGVISVKEREMPGEERFLPKEGRNLVERSRLLGKEGRKKEKE